MRFVGSKYVLLMVLSLASFPLAASAQTGSPSPVLITPVKEVPHSEFPSDGSLLPRAFSGWLKAPGARLSTDPVQAGPTRAAMLKETGMAAYEHAVYTRQGRRLEINAFRFNDATGAYAAYSALQDGPLAPEKFCEHAGSNGNRALMACTTLVVEVTYDKVSPMAPAELRSLVAQLPKATGTSASTPSAPLYLPRNGVTAVRFALGPAGLAHTRTLLPAELIDFSKGAEVVTGEVGAESGSAIITIVRYPTFALAIDRQKAFDAWAKSRPIPAPPSGTAAQSSETFYSRRVGPLVAVISGPITASDARTLAEQVPYDVEITENEPVYSPKDNIGNLVVNMLYLSFIIIGFTFVTGVAFGGVRILARKYFPGRFIDRPEDIDFIKLDLRD